MAWTVPKTWYAGNVWLSGDANTYIRDNTSSLRNYQQMSARLFADAKAGVGTSLAQVGQHLQLATMNTLAGTAFAPDETYIVEMMAFQITANSTSGNVANLQINDQSGGVQISGGNQMPVSSVYELAGVAFGSWSPGPNVNPGYTAYVSANTAGPTILVACQVIMRPGN